MIFGSRQKQSLVLFLAIVLGLVLLNLRQAASPEQQIERAVRSLARSAEQKELAAFRELLAEDFRDDGGRTREEALALLKLLYLRHPRIAVTLVSLEVHMQGQDGAEVELTALLSENILPQDRGDFALVFSRRKGKWLLTSADWGGGYGTH
jgi:hypothetical protein